MPLGIAKLSALCMPSLLMGYAWNATAPSAASPGIGGPISTRKHNLASASSYTM